MIKLGRQKSYTKLVFEKYNGRNDKVCHGLGLNGGMRNVTGNIFGRNIFGHFKI